VPRHAVHVDAPPATVYELIANPRRRARWLPELQTTGNMPQRLLEVGDRFVGHTSMLAHRFVGASEVTEAQPNDHLEEDVVIGARFRTRWDIAPDDDGDGDGEHTGCRVTHDIDVEFPQGPLGRIERWVLSRYLDRLQRRGLQRLAATAAAAR
jgi:carbon monoxide dehydrogenase subunit G